MDAPMCPEHGVARSNPTGFCKICGARLIRGDAGADASSAGSPRPPMLLHGLPLNRRMLMFGGAAVALLVVVLIVWKALQPPAQPSGFNPTTGPFAPTMTSQSSAAAVATPGRSNQTVTVEIVAPTSESAPTPTALALATPAQTAAIVAALAIATKLDPQSAFAGTLPITLTVSGTHLDQVHEATLTRSDGVTATLKLEPGASDHLLRLIISALPDSAPREQAFMLQLDGRAQEVTPLLIQDYIESKTVAGVKAAYMYTDRINPQSLYTRMRAVPDVTSEPGGKLTNGDSVDILQNDVAGWYRVRIQASGDASQNGSVGWIERWLVDDAGVPPAPPTPTPLQTARFSARTDVNFEGSGESGQFSSCIAGRVRTANLRPIAGAQLNVNNGPKNSYPATTGSNGEYRVCGLGASHWSVVLRRVPGVRLAVQVVGVVYLNGSAQEGIVHFTQQP